MFYHCDVMICHAFSISKVSSNTLSCNFATAIRSVAVRALESHAAGSGFKAQWSHYIYFIKIESHCISFFLVRARVRAASGISSEWLRISDKPDE